MSVRVMTTMEGSRSSGSTLLRIPIRPNTFCEPNDNDASFLHSNALTVYPTQSAQWFVVMSSFAEESNRHLRLRSCCNDVVVSITQTSDATNLSVHFPEDRRRPVGLLCETESDCAGGAKYR